MADTKKTWGGARANSGRPKLKEHRVGVTVRVLPITQKRLQALKAEGYDTNQMIDDTVEIAVKDLLLEDKH